MSDYPDDCPAFEVTWSGEHVEGSGACGCHVRCRLLRVVAVDRVFWEVPRYLRPLTQAARDMLALVAPPRRTS